MLENQGHLKYAQSLIYEWQQAVDEGKDVAYLEQICTDITNRAYAGEYCYDIAVAIRQKLLDTPVSAGFIFNEPSTLEEIKALRPAYTQNFENTLNNEQLKEKHKDDLKDHLKDHLYGAFIGRISGCLLGKPVEGQRRKQLYAILKGTDNFPMHKYICKKDFTDELLKDETANIDLGRCWADTLCNIAPVDDDTNYTILAMKLIDTYGLDFRPNDVLEAWLSWMPIFATFTAERVTYQNTAMGMTAPETASFNNPFREWIGAQIRADFYGYINPANPEKAAELAFRDASISHVKNGIYGAMFVAAMLSAAFSTDCIKEVIHAGLGQVPADCRLSHEVLEVMKWYDDGVSAYDAIARVHDKYDEYSGHWWCHTITNAMIVVIGLLYGEKDLGKSICIAVTGAYDTDCNGATVGSIIGMMIGKSNIDPYWYEPYNLNLATSIDGFNTVTVDYLVDKTISFIG